MDINTVSRQKYTAKKGNKENVQPAQEIKSFIKQKAPAGLLQPKGHKKDTGKEVTAKQAIRNQQVGEQALKNTAILKKSTSGIKPTHSQTFKAEQAAKLKKQVGEAPKPRTASEPPRLAPGMYKGKIIESKIGSIWKSSVAVSGENLKSTVTKPAGQRPWNLTKSSSTSASGHGTQTSVNKSVKPTVDSHPIKAFSSARPPARSVPTAARPRNATLVQSRRCGTLIAKPKVPVSDKKASKPPVTSTISQFRANSETAEEKREKLAEWLASKGKTLKRPALVASAPSTKTKVSTKPGAHAKSQHAAKSKLEPEVKEHKPAFMTRAHSADNQQVVKTETRTSLIVNTTLDLLENSDLDLPVEPQDSGSDRVDDIVINLCDALEALETPSQCNNEYSEVHSNLKKESKQEEKRSEISYEKVKSEVSVSDDSDNQDVQDVTEESDEDCYVNENTPPMEEASVVKYSVKTTPFLQSVKKTIEDEICTSTSKRKSNIKDIKFLTPVRRSSRIHRQSSRLPLMLVDHDPCVSSLAELVKLDDDANAYIYRKNPALLEDLPDQSRL